MRLIDADLLKLNDFEILLGGSYKGLLQILLEKIEDAPTVDAVKVVRCKDCEFAHMTYGGECKYCDIWEDEGTMYLDGDFYCASGKRREESGDN